MVQLKIGSRQMHASLVRKHDGMFRPYGSR
jgi:hypothetical protein